MTEDAYAHSEYHGRPLDVATIAAVKEAEARLGYELTIIQGIGGAATSAGTHLKGRVIDLATWDATRKLRVLKDVGFDIWFRPTIPGLWHEHLHGCLVLNSLDNQRGIAPAAFRQIGSFQRRRDGLKGDRPDYSYRPDPPAVFHYPPKEPPMPKPPHNNVTEARDALVEAAHALGVAAAKLEATDAARVVAHSQVDDIRALARGAHDILGVLPEK